MATTKEYILGTDKEELQRLEIQHRVWADAAVQAWKRAGIGPGSNVLDLGCGPGHASFDLAQLVTEAGRILALDESEYFVSYLNHQAGGRGLPQLQAKQADAENLNKFISPDEKFDAVYCRWVLCWLKSPEKALTGIQSVLKPRGRFIIHDYFNWHIMNMGPRSAAIEKMVQAAIQSFTARHADLDIAARLPALLRDSGFRISHFEVYQRVARGGGIDSTLAWPLTWWRSYGPKLVKMGFLNAAVYEQAAKDLAVLETNSDYFFFCPPVFEFIAERL